MTTGPAWLGAAEWARLAPLAERRRYDAGTAIIREGGSQAALFLVVDGFVRVERAGREPGIAVARLGAGEAFGEMSLLEDDHASASVVADGVVTVDVIPHEQLHVLLSSDTNFSSQFYRSLATVLSARLRATSARLAESTSAAARPRREALTGLVTDRQIPPDLAYAVAEFRARMWDVEEAVAKRSSDDSARGVAEACDALVASLTSHLRDESLVEAGYNDLMAFRDPAAMAAGLGAFVFRESFSLLMTSATIARLHGLRTTEPLDADAVEMILADIPAGDGPVGAFVDRWFLSRPASVARRDARARAARAINRASASAVLPAILSLSTRAPHEILDAVEPGKPLRVTLIDSDESSLRRGAALLARSKDVSAFPVLATLPLIADGGSGLTLDPQRLVYGIGVADLLDDEALLGLLEWAHANLASGGELLFDVTLPDGADRPLLDHLVGRPAITRTSGQVASLLQRSPFRDRAHVECDALGVSAWVSARAG
jgi:CRP-like cAMP-binding protein